MRSIESGLPLWIFGCTSVSWKGFFGCHSSSHEIHENNHKNTKTNKVRLKANPHSTLPRPPTPKPTKINENHQKGDRGGEKKVLLLLKGERESLHFILGCGR